MTGIIGIAVLIVRVTRSDPMTVPMGRIAVVTSDPDVLTIPPFVMTGDPDSRLIGALPLLIIFPVPRGGL